jgi:Leucine-rich repeat (LRR) protein
MVRPDAAPDAAPAPEKERSLWLELTTNEEEVSALQFLSTAHGWKEAEKKQPEKITSIEVVLDDFSDMTCLRHFRNLQTVCLINQGISRIAGLDGATQLTKLWLNENELTTLEGLSSCGGLKCLYCCSNAISSFEGVISHLSLLETLWLADNRLAGLQGLETLPQLIELNVAQNRITKCNGVFDNSLQLKVLDLSQNRIANFAELSELACLPHLEELNLSNPDWGENPVCSLSNYSTHMVRLIGSLRVLAASILRTMSWS